MTKIAYLDKDAYGAPPVNLGRAEDFNEIKGSVNALYGNVVTELPANDATKVGQRFWLNGTEWTYAYEGQFGTLAAGTVWPVRGYKEYVALLTQSGTDAPTENKLHKNEIGTVALARDNIGIYTMRNPLITDTNTDLSYSSILGQGTVFITSMQAIPGSIAINSYQLDVASVNYVLADFLQLNLQLRIYPPTA